jgi:hypothetical protein
MPPEPAYFKYRLFGLALVVWGILTLILCGRSFLAPQRATVYPIFSEAARGWCRGEDCYRTVLQDQYRYSPPATVLLVPFALLPDALGGVLWRLVGVAAYVAALCWWMRAVLHLPPFAVGAGALLLLALPLSLGNVNNGQSNVLVLALLLTTTAAAATGRWTITAVAVSVACLIKGYPAAVALLLSAVFPCAFAGRFTLCLLAGLALPFLFQDPPYVLEQYEHWVEHLGQDDRQHVHCEATYRDLRLLCRVAGAPLSAGVFRAVQLAGGAFVLGVCLLGRRAGWSRPTLLREMLHLVCCWMVLLGPATESCTYMLLAPLFGWSLLEACRHPRQGALLALTLLGTGTLFFCCVASWFPWGRSVHALGLQPLGAMFLLGRLLVGYLQQMSCSLPSRLRLAEVNSDSRSSTQDCPFPSA